MSNSLQPHGLYTVHGIPQARILEWVVFPFSRGSSQPRDWTQVSCIAGGFFPSWATGEAHKAINWAMCSLWIAVTFYWDVCLTAGFPGGSDSKESAFNAGDPGFNPWVRKIPWRREWQLTPAFLPGESHGQRSWQATVHGVANSQAGLKRLKHALDWTYPFTKITYILAFLFTSLEQSSELSKRLSSRL